MTDITTRCAVCRNSVLPDNDHIKVTAESINMNSPDQQDDYMLHIDCWMSISEGWTPPA